MTADRPNPDELIASLQRDAVRARRGRLKVFFGMCPGVGKTFAMLRAAHQDLREGVDLVIGIVETHGRSETEALVAGIPSVPRKSIPYRNIVLSELDLEAVLARKPRLVLVDEFAHTNAPDSRHPKRYQDVIELLDAGIDVYTTLNVQHLESRADAVRQITGATVTETVPDSVFEIVDEVELIDITPQALLERLHEGKVYISTRADAAASNFFKDANLTALRELALRFVAECVDKRLRELRAAGPLKTVWRSGERLLVGVGPSPSSTQLVRWTRRMAAAQGAAWTAVSVESARPLSADARARVEQNLALARELGAEVVITHDEAVADALLRVALQNNATQIVLGKSRGNRWLRLLTGGTLTDQVLRRSGGVDIYIVPAERTDGSPPLHLDWQGPGEGWGQETIEVAAWLAALTGASWFLVPASGYLAIGLIYLFAVVVLSLRVGRWPVLFAGIVSAVTWDFLFIPPVFTFSINKIEDAFMFGSYIAVALVSGQLTARVRQKEKNERLREARAMALFHLTQALSAARSLDEAVFAALRQVDTLFEAQTAFLLADDAEQIVPHFAGSYILTPKERGVSEWVWRNKKRAGRFTDTLPSAEAFHVPLVREASSLGVLVVRVDAEKILTLAQRDLIENFAAQLALVVESENFRAGSERAKLAAESEKLHRVLLDAVSHELKTPLAILSAATESMQLTPDPGQRDVLLQEMRTANRRLNRLVDNLLDQTRLESGALRPRLDWCDAHDLVNAAVEGVGDAMLDHPLETAVPPDMPLFRADFALMEQVVANLLLNAAHHTPKGTSIFLAAGLEKEKNRIFFTVADRGPGLPESMHDRVFKKFQRGDAARAGGLGLGLSIISGFVSAQGGEIVVGKNPGGGAVFTVYLPHATHGEVPVE